MGTSPFTTLVRMARERGRRNRGEGRRTKSRDEIISEENGKVKGGKLCKG